MIAASMYGNTTPLVMRMKSSLEKDGYEVMVFTLAVGTKAMELLMERGSLLLRISQEKT
jgi:uncharacterized protein (UPF0261 family)